MGEPRDPYLEKLKTQLDEWNRELNRLEAEIQKAKADERNRYEIRIKGIGEKELVNNAAGSRTAPKIKP
jgi:hypothetical protein